MSRYFFHIRDGQILVPDEEGMECRNLLAAQEEAWASAIDMKDAALRSYSARPAASVEIEDELGNTVHGTAPARWMN